MNKQNKPELRFKGFSEAWEQHVILDLFDKIIDFRGRTPKKLGMSWSNFGYLALSALNVKNGYIDFNIDAHYGDQELYDRWMCGNELYKGQVLFTTEAPMGNVVQIPDNKKYILSQRTIAFEVKSKLIVENFLAVILGSPVIINKLNSIASGGTAIGVSQKSLSNLDILISNNLTEQKKIGNFFRTLDQLITLQQNKYDKLVNLKKACLKKMFPQAGADKPELRFKGFSGDWERKKLGEESEIVAGGDINKCEMVESGKYPVYANALTFDGLLGYYNDYYRIKAPSVTVTGRGDVGHAKARKNNYTPVVRLLAVNSNHDIFFLEKAINNHKVFIESTGVPQLTVPQLKMYQIFFPTFSEQSKIGKFFQTLDQLIDLRKTELNKLKNLKKSCLAKMFI